MDDRHKDQAYRLAKIGHWELDIKNEKLYWSDQVKLLHEVPMDYKPELEEAIAFYPEGDHRERVRKAVEAAIKEGAPISFEAKIITAKGNNRWIRALGESEIEDGECVYVYGSTQDITAQREAEKEARQVHKKLQDIIDHSTILFYRHDADHNLTYVSQQSQQFLGCPPEEAKKKWTEFVTDHPKNKEGIKKTEHAIRTGESQPTYELQLQRTDGKKIWVQVNESPVVRNGETVEIVGSLTDITDLKDKETQLRNIANNIDGMIMRYVLYPDGSDENPYVSDGVRDLFELPPEVVLESTDPVWAQFDEDHIDDVQQSVRESAQNLTNWDYTWKIETPSGKEKWINGRGTPKKLDDGSVQWDTILLDVTDQKELEQDMSRQVSLLNHILDSLPGLFYILNEDATFKRVNRNVEKLFNKSAEQLEGTSALNLIAPREKERTKKVIQKVFKEGYSDIETVLVDGDGKEHHYYVTGSYLESDGNPYLIGNGIEITDRVKAEEEKSVLLREVHHRVKNNLAIISSILNLELDELPADSRNRISLERSVNRIKSIAKVHELLYQSDNFSKININLYVSELINTVLNTFSADNSIDQQLDVDDVTMNLNEITPLGMLLNELLTNSFKYAFQDQDEGIIKLDITQHAHSYDVSYSDNGRGFDQSLFEESKTLGFSIIKVLLQQLDADYEFDSSDGFNIDFTFDKRKSGAYARL